jgi:hypothetical protein
VVFQAVLEGPTFLAALPVFRVGGDVVFEYQSALPIKDPLREKPIVTLLNSSTVFAADSVTLSLYDFESGAVNLSRVLSLPPAGIESIDLSDQHGTAGPAPTGLLRLGVSDPSGQVQAYGLKLMPDATATEIPLIARRDAHQSGIYALPSLETHTAHFTLVNLGSVPAEVIAHLTWERGEYALRPVTLGSGAGHHIDFGALLAADVPDPLGRHLDPTVEQAFFQWTSPRGSGELIARMQIQSPDGSDSFGFNCISCCPELPFGAVEPTFATLPIGAVGAFSALEYVSTCTGQIGPFFTSPTATALTYSTPLHWDARNVSATAATSQTPSFESYGNYVRLDCSTRLVFFGDDGPVVVEDDCQREHNPGFDVKKGCCGMHSTDVEMCNDCCDKQLAVARCRCDKLPILQAVCKAEAELANTTCHNQCNLGCGDV